MKIIEKFIIDIIIYRTVDDKVKIALYAKDGAIRLNQNQSASFFDTSKQTISCNIIKILKNKELYENSVVKNFLTAVSDGKNYKVTFLQFEAKQADFVRFERNRSLVER
jgi:virulence protein